MIFSHLFDFVGTLADWLSGLLPTTGCSTVASFTGFNVGWLAAFIDLPVAASILGIFLAFEVTMFGFRLAVGIYKLLPLSGGG